jgi:RNA polymerase sigma-70 factor (ECF subfamily)
VLTEEMTSEALVERMTDGDVHALSALYDRHAAAAFGLACRIVRDPAEAEDVVQEAFLQVWRQAAGFDRARASVGGWLSMITRSRALDRLRRRAVRVRYEGEQAVGEVPAPSTSWSHSRLVRADEGHEVRRELEALPGVQRVAVELAFYEGLTHAEIADALCQPLGTVKSRIRCALHRMRDSLNGSPAPPRRREPAPFTIALADYLASHPRRTSAPRSLHGLRVLVVDDDEDTVDLVATVLRSAGAGVMTARSAADGVTSLGVSWPDVLLADITMPQVDGYGLLRQAQALASASRRPLTAAAFTALGLGERERALRAGFLVVLAKPVSPHLLVDAMAGLARPAA